MMKRVTGCAPKMWGTSIVGFDQYHYRYDSGHEGDSLHPRLLVAQGADQRLYRGRATRAQKTCSTRLGKHKVGKACLYIGKLDDVKLPVLEELLVRAVAATRKRYPATP